MLGTFDIARAYLAYTVVANVAREASRYGAAHANDPLFQPTDAITKAGLNLAIGIDTSVLSLTGTTTTLPGLTYSYFKVSGTYRFHSLTPLVGALMGDPIIILVNTSALVG